MLRPRKIELLSSSVAVSFPVSVAVSIVVSIAVSIVGFASSAVADEPSPDSAAKQRQPAQSILPDGLYAVVRSSHETKSVEPVAQTETLVANDFHLLEPAEREPVLYMVLQTKPFVPLTLAAAPQEDKEESTGKPRLQLQLAEDEKGPLEDFTRAHLGGTVAIVIGGDVVTAHKVRSVITGGRLQITRCTKHGCETLFTQLLKDRPRG